MFLVPGREKVITGGNLHVPVTCFLMGLIISPYHVARMLTSAVLNEESASSAFTGY